MSAIDELQSLIAARVPYIWVTTSEEDRLVIDIGMQIAVPKKMKMSVWSATAGIKRLNKYNSPKTVAGTENLMKALEVISKEPEAAANSSCIYIMKDLFLLPPEIRIFRDKYENFVDQGKTLIIVSPFLAHGPGGAKEGLPPTLEKQICVVEYELPNHEHILQRIKRGLGEENVDKYTNKQLDELARALRGLTSIEIDNAIATCFVENNSNLDVNHLLKFKKQSVKKSQILEFLDSDVDIKDVGGLDLVKEYFERYKDCFSQEAAEFGVEPIKLIILTGVPGVGKSLTCKTIGHLFKLPLLSLDMGRIFGSRVGQSEQRIREVISTLESNAPCICMIDEIEKGLSGTHSSSHSDGGTTSRVFGTLLTAIQDRLKDVILIATANNITSIPPEFIRRANEIFFVDLPSAEERWDILRIHLEKRKRKFELFNDIKNDFIEASDKFTGSEIEKAVKDALARAFYSGCKELKEEHLLSALSEIKPIAQVMEEQIKELQDWAKGHARYASSSSEEHVESSIEQVEIEERPRLRKLRKLN